MRWSQLRKQVEDRFAPSVQGRIALRTAHYRHAHDSDGRAWIEIDGREVATMCYFQALRARWDLAKELGGESQETDAARDHHTPPDRDAYAEAIVVSRRAGILSQQDFYALLHEYLRQPIDTLLSAEDPVTRGLAVLDRRTGKRRLRTMAITPDEHPLVREMLSFRCAAEGITIAPNAT